MPIHDSYVLDNDTGANFRTDLNNLLLALKTSNSSPTAPPNPVAGMFWTDTSATPVLLKLRDPTNSGWLTIFDITNNAGLVASTASTSSAINGVALSTVPNTPNTIAGNDASTSNISNNIIGNFSGYAGTVGGSSLSSVLDISTKSHAPLKLDNTLGVYVFNACQLRTQQATTGNEAVLTFTSAFSGDISIIHNVQHTASASTKTYYIAHNGTQIGSTYNSVALGVKDLISTPSGSTLTVSVGDTIAIYSTLGGEAGSEYVQFTCGLSNNNQGVYSGELW